MATATIKPGNAPAQPISRQNRSAMLLPKPAVPRRQDRQHILSLVGMPSSTERRALRQIVEEADLLEVDGRMFLLAPISPDTVEVLASFESEAADLEDGDEDCCCVRDDFSSVPNNFAIGMESCLPGDPEDAEDDGPAEGC